MWCFSVQFSTSADHQSGGGRRQQVPPHKRKAIPRFQDQIPSAKESQVDGQTSPKIYHGSAFHPRPLKWEKTFTRAMIGTFSFRI